MNNMKYVIQVYYLSLIRINENNIYTVELKIIHFI